MKQLSSVMGSAERGVQYLRCLSDDKIGKAILRSMQTAHLLKTVKDRVGSSEENDRPTEK